ncbi:MAG: hypothetical protein GY760_23280 [Deltaproteobacteria bacterium]|nr:hypothetical protein [Deltaproteobacteria bacterium]
MKTFNNPSLRDKIREGIKAIGPNTAAIKKRKKSILSRHSVKRSFSQAC